MRYETIFVKIVDGKEVDRFEQKNHFKGKLRTWNALEAKRKKEFLEAGYQMTSPVQWH